MLIKQLAASARLGKALQRVKGMTRQWQAVPSQHRHWVIDHAELIWALGSVCALNRVPFDPELLTKHFPPPNTTDNLIHGLRELGFKAKLQASDLAGLPNLTFPSLALVAPKTQPPVVAEAADAVVELDQEPEAANEELTPAAEGQAGEPAMERASMVIVADATPERVLFFDAGTNTPQELSPQAFAERYLGFVLMVALKSEAVRDPDAADEDGKGFGFKWFVPELLKHKEVWRDVLIASLVIQLLALGTPLFTQTIIDKVVVHRTESTLIVIAIGLAVFMIFSALLTWVRQYLVLHTGNRVDSVLAASVFDHLFKLPPRYFEHRPTGVIAARLHGVETIREFVASAAVTLILDLPFLLIFVGIMFYYSVMLTLIVLAILGVIAFISFITAPMFQKQLNEQFMLGARNQAFLTEYVAGIETV
jgi:subfamily B ATP-binding cassette protein HlyB/CyaB